MWSLMWVSASPGQGVSLSDSCDKLGSFNYPNKEWLWFQLRQINSTDATSGTLMSVLSWDKTLALVSVKQSYGSWWNAGEVFQHADF